MRFRLLFYAFFILTQNLLSQDFKGIVINKNTHKPVSECLAIIKGTTVSALTDEQGKFNFVFSAGNQNNTLVLTMLGYITIEYDLSTYKKDTFYITPKNILLKEVVVAANKKNILNPKSDESILDFDLLNDDLIILTAGNQTSKNSLKLMDETGKVLASLKVDRHAEILKHDCIGNLHLLSNDSAWQVFNDYTKLNTLKPYPTQIFDLVLGNCVCMNNKNYYFQNRTYRNLRVNYFYYNEDQKGIRHELIKFQDSTKIRSFDLDYNLQYFLDVRRKSHFTMYNEPVDSMIKKLDQYREELPLDWTYRKWLGKVETQMIKTDTNVFIINFTDTAIYDITKKNEVHYKVKFSVYKNKKLLPHVYVDADYNEMYLIAFAENKLAIIKFDINTGLELSRTEIPNVPFLPKKIIINSGKAFFIQKNLTDEQSYKIIKYYLN